MFWFGRGRTHCLKNFQQELRRGRLSRRYGRGLQIVPVDQVVGSVNKWASLNRQFRCPGDTTDFRLQRIRQAYRWGTGVLPPVELYQLDGEYFVVDGHHRLAVAIENGQVEIDAYVTTYEIEEIEVSEPA